MNLELIRELTALHSRNTSYTEMAEITGMARTSIVLALRLNTIFENAYSSQIATLNNEIELLKSSMASFESQIMSKDAEITKLCSLLDMDDKNNMIVSKSSQQVLQNEVGMLRAKVDSLNADLRHERNYLDSLSFVGKMKILFQ